MRGEATPTLTDPLASCSGVPRCRLRRTGWPRSRRRSRDSTPRRFASPDTASQGSRSCARRWQRALRRPTHRWPCSDSTRRCRGCCWSPSESTRRTRCRWHPSPRSGFRRRCDRKADEGRRSPGAPALAGRRAPQWRSPHQFPPGRHGAGRLLARRQEPGRRCRCRCCRSPPARTSCRLPVAGSPKRFDVISRCPSASQIAVALPTASIATRALAVPSADTKKPAPAGSRKWRTWRTPTWPSPSARRRHWCCRCRHHPTDEDPPDCRCCGQRHVRPAGEGCRAVGSTVNAGG